METPSYHSAYRTHDDNNISILETNDASASEYAQESEDDGGSTAYLHGNADTPSARTHDGQNYEEEYDHDASAVAAAAHIEDMSTSSSCSSSSWSTMALLANYVAIGLTHALFQTLLYPFLKIYLNMDEYRASSAEMLIALPWSFKLAIALLSDCVPIRNQRRIPYVTLGWLFCGVFALVIACLPSEQPYSGQDGDAAAASKGGKYIFLFFVASLGLVIADVACDGMVIALSRHETDSQRGKMLLTCLMARYTGHGGMAFFVALLCNSVSYGGTFGWASSPNAMLFFVVVASLAALVATRLYMVEDGDDLCPANQMPHQKNQFRTQIQSPSSQSSTTLAAAAADPLSPLSRRIAALPGPTQRQLLWTYLQKRATWQLMIYVFLVRVCFGYYTSTTKALYETWLHVSPLLSNLFTVVNSLTYVAAAYLLKRLSSSSANLLTNWRRVIQGTVALSIVLTIVPTLFVIWISSLRSAFVTLLVEQLVGFVDAVVYCVLLLVILEATYEPLTTNNSRSNSKSHVLECTKFTLLTSLANAALPFASSLSQSVGAHFDTYDNEWASDTSAVRWKMMGALVVWVVVRLLNLALLPLLPPRKHDMLVLKAKSKTHRRTAMCVCSCAAFVWLWALLVTFLAAFETTACLTVAGGEGC